MIRSLRTGVTGILTNQKRMDLIGNNVANANTVAFKRSRASFSEMMAQEVATQSDNPDAIGLGTELASIDQSFEQGSLEATGERLDLALTGDGFFMVRDGDRDLLTRAGNFGFSSEGVLTSPSGLPVQGWGFDADGNLQTGKPGDVKLNFDAKAPAKYTQTAEVGGNMDSQMAVGDTSSISTTVYDAQGNPHDVVVNFEKTAANTFEYTVNGPFVTSETDTIEFDSAGTAVAGESITLEWNGDNVDNGELEIDMSSLVQRAGSTTSKFTGQDGYQAGSISGYSFDQEGVLSVQYTNGESEQVYQLALGSVNNPNGLANEGQNMFSVTHQAGDLQIGRAGRDLATTVRAGTLEQSNVDMAEEFSDMIVAQRGYQAAARVVTTSDELLQELVRLKR